MNLELIDWKDGYSVLAKSDLRQKRPTAQMRIDLYINNRPLGYATFGYDWWFTRTTPEAVTAALRRFKSANHLAWNIAYVRCANRFAETVGGTYILLSLHLTPEAITIFTTEQLKEQP